MAVALLSVFDIDVAQNIHDFISRRPDVEWEEIAGYTMIYKTKHLQTYSGGPEGDTCTSIRRGSPGGIGGIGLGIGSQPVLLLMMV